MQKLYGGTPSATLEPSEIIARMMLPMLNEVARCLDEGIVETPHKPIWRYLWFRLPFRGGAYQYIDSLVLRTICKRQKNGGISGLCMHLARVS